MQTTFLDQCEQALARHARLWVYTLLSGPHRGATCLAAPEPLQQADAAFNPFLTQPRPQQGAVLLEDGQGGACFVQCFGVQPQLVICGAGHISQPLCQVAKLLDFAVTVIDDRAEFANRARFAQADTVLAMPFAQAFAQMRLHLHTYCVIVTRGHLQDEACLELALAQPLAYVGMIGSRTKVARCMEQMRRKGWADETLARVYAPIGLMLGGQTPAEIAVDIAAQLVKVRNEQPRPQPWDAALADMVRHTTGPLVLATIVDKQGSGPRQAGARMLIGAQGRLYGTVGGGAVEQAVLADAQALLNLQANTDIKTYDLSAADASALGMVCGGQTTVWLERIQRS